MKVRKINFYALSQLLIGLVWLVSSCQEDEYIDNPKNDLSGEGICFGVSKDISSWKPDSRTLLQADTVALPCESMDATFGMNVIATEKENHVLSRGIQTTSKETLKEFDVSAYYYEDGVTTAELFFEEEVTDGVNTTGKTYYWPHEGTMDFIAITPLGIANPMPSVGSYNNNTASFSYAVPVDETGQKDIMVANALGLNNRTTGNPVGLVFKHLFASVRFIVGEMQFIKIESLSINNVYGGNVTFTYNKTTNSWTNTVPATKVTYSPDFVDTSGLPQGSEIAGNMNNATLFMIPQTLPADAVINVSYTELLTGETKSGVVKIGGYTWEAGKDYAYAFKIGTTFDVTIPTPKDQDAHYVILKMDYDLGELSGTLSDIVATASFLEDGSNTATTDKNDITLKTSLTTTQAQGLFTDEQWKMAYKVLDGGGTDPANPTPVKVGSIVGEPTLSITSNSGSIYLFLDENNGTTDRNGELTFTAKVNETNQEIVIGQGKFKQLCPSWSDGGIGVERIEDVGYAHPYGFDYNRKVTYSNSLANQYWGSWLDWLRQLILLFTGSTANEIIPDSEGIAEGFVTIEETNAFSSKVVSSITLDYSALNKVEAVANDDDGMKNTKALYNFTGDTDISELETLLDDNLSSWDKADSNEDEEQPVDYAAYVALTRNRMRELCIEITGKNAQQKEEVTTLYEAELHEDADGNDIIEWYLPSSKEAKTLKETGTSAQGISSLDGTYWSSTAGNDANGYAHSYTFNYNVLGGVNESASRMTEYKVRAVRKKP